MSIRQGKKLIASSTTNGFSLFECKWADHILNNISWLRADTFSWQSGNMYKAAYEHLGGDLDTVQKLYCWIGEKMGDKYYTYSESPSVGETTTDGDAITRFDSYGRPVVGAEYLDRYPDGDTLSTQTDTISDITITYYLAEDGHKICASDQESNISALYAKTGAADYFILDTTNKQFKLPRKQKRALIQAVKNTDGTWYNLYSDGWIEQGGQLTTLSTTAQTITLPIIMADTSYYANANYAGTTQTTSPYAVWVDGITTTSIRVRGTNSTAVNACKWQVSGYAAESAYASAGMQFEYYYVGNFEQSAVEQTTGINAETLNSKADADLGNIPANYDYVVNWQEPTSANGYTWYRKYKSGWVEQGGLITNATVYTLPVTMANTNYYVSVTWDGGKSANFYPADFRVTSLTTVSFQTTASRNGSNVQGRCWEVKGMAA